MSSLKELKIRKLDIYLSSAIYTLHKENEEIYLTEIIRKYEELFGKRYNKKELIKRLKEFEERGFIKFYYKEIKRGIPKNVAITDKLILFQKLYILLCLCINEEEKFDEIAVKEFEKILEYLKNVKVKKDGKKEKV